MPITQERVLALLDEYEDFIKARNVLVTALRRVLAMRDVPSDMKLELIESELAAMQYVPTTLAMIERRHFNTFGRRNLRMRAKMARRRTTQRLLDGDHEEPLSRPIGLDDIV